MDYLSFMLITYDKLCRLNISQISDPCFVSYGRSNKIIEIPDNEKRKYLEYMIESGLHRKIRKKGEHYFYNLSSSFDDFMEKIDELPVQLEGSLRRFDKSFSAYWEKLNSDISSNLVDRQNLLDMHFDKIYDISKEWAGSESNLSDICFVSVKGGFSRGA